METDDLTVKAQLLEITICNTDENYPSAKSLLSAVYLSLERTQEALHAADTVLQASPHKFWIHYTFVGCAFPQTFVMLSGSQLFRDFASSSSTTNTLVGCLILFLSSWSIL